MNCNFLFLLKTGSVCFYFDFFFKKRAVCKHFLIPSDVKVIVKAK